MKKGFLRTRKILPPTLLVLILSIVTILGGTTSPTFAVTQTDPTTTVYLDPPTIQGVIAQTFRVDINIRDSPNVTEWKAKVAFNATLLECIGCDEGEFLKKAGQTYWTRTINNTAGVITAWCSLLMHAKTSGSGRLAYATFRFKASGISDLHLRDVEAYDWIMINDNWVEKMVPINIIDVYTAIVDTTRHTVVTVSNSTGKTAEYGSGFYDHSFSIPDKEISFKVTGPYTGFSNVTIPKALLNVSTSGKWNVAIDGILLGATERIITENATHTSIYFTYSAGVHHIQITTRQLPIYVFEVRWDDNIFHVVIESNSTVSEFIFNPSLAQISFNVTGPDDGTAFCNVTIPKALMWVDDLDEWNVTIDGTPLSPKDISVTENATHYFIYFTCVTSTLTIRVISKYVIPEFPTWASILLMLVVLTVAIAIYKRRLLKTPIR
ncbi:MAG: cohesin domain-containing protein [Candidatus Bathyarchaeaceae archaeon]